MPRTVYRNPVFRVPEMEKFSSTTLTTPQGSYPVSPVMIAVPLGFKLCVSYKIRAKTSRAVSLSETQPSCF